MEAALRISIIEFSAPLLSLQIAAALRFKANPIQDQSHPCSLAARKMACCMIGHGSFLYV